MRPDRHGTPRVAVLIGSWFNVSLNQQGHNLRANLLEPLKADLHLQLTYRSDDRCNSPESCGLAKRFSGLVPIAQIHLERQRTIEELIDMLAISSHWPRLEKWYVDAGGCRKKSGRDRADGSPYTCSRIPEQGNSFMAPVFGRSSLNVLRQIYLQSRVLERLQAFEERHGSQYDAVVWTRFEMHWLAPHPPLSALPIQSCLWTPIGEDYAGLNDRHAIFRRDLAPIYLGRWDALLNGRLFDIWPTDKIGRQSSERYLAKWLAYHNVSHCYFPSVAYLMCCGAAGHCYKNACFRMQVEPALGLLENGTAKGPPPLHASGKYPKEVASALLHAAALQHPKAQLHLVTHSFAYAGHAHSTLNHGPDHLAVALPTMVHARLRLSRDIRRVRQVLGQLSYNYTLLA